MEEFKLVPDDSLFVNLTPDEVSLIFYLLGLAIAPSLTIDELNVLANGLFLTAQVLFVIASQRTLLNDAQKAQEEEAAKKPKEDITSVEKLEPEIKKLQSEIKKLQDQINTLQGLICT